ncbi:efflux RND transporter periplasmic adaptor subunit [Robertkochia solimangrovi]|uniref:efflux RND transporter periplasmic adaptor subunit n=1 Tax=Robertkochia solimangrovi TaxID=2213046 RepID=UPI00117DAF76|nr:efflux RND transporter periplasmic adaptor subunit [Robertkochia solimangrovi]TRZ45865.1 efflux RND transporter periplasmic adaptor subunit [Robertkochia solimangrovi]
MKLRSNLILLTLVAILAVGCGEENGAATPQGAQKLPFPVANLEPMTLTGYNVFPVSIEGVINSDVRAKVSGYIQKVLVDEGQRVRKGQALFKLETQTLSQDAEAAKARVNVAQVEVDKLVPLVEKNIISNVQLETAKANLAQAKSNYNSIAANIGYATVKSPVNGYVGSIPFREGALVSPSDQVALTKVIDIEQVYAYFTMNEKDYLDFLQNTPGETLTERVANFPDVKLQLANGSVYPVEGKIQTVTGQIDPNTGTVTFRAVFDNPRKLLTNGNSGKVMIPKTYKDAIVVPQVSTFEQQGNIFVYRVSDSNTVKSVKLDIKDVVNNLYVISSGVNKGDLIVAEGAGKLRNGMGIIPQTTPFDSIIKPATVLFK